jgi:hypothetical protein
MLHNCIDFKKKEERLFPKTGSIVKFVNCGSTVDAKNQTVFIDVMDLLINSENITNIELSILGDGYLKKELGEKIRKLKLEKYVFLKGKYK